MAKKPGKIYQLEIWLDEIEPRIWRKFEVPFNIRLDKFNDVIQDVMGWTNSHLHSFNVGEEEYSMPYPGDESYNEGMLDERKAKLTDLVDRLKDRFVYVYDLGDNWEHIVELVEIKEPQPGVMRGRPAGLPARGQWWPLELSRIPGHIAGEKYQRAPRIDRLAGV